MSNIRASYRTLRMECSICSSEIVPDSNGWDGGHNAYPVTIGRCCELCNREVVLPRRLRDSGFSQEAINSLPENFPS